MLCSALMALLVCLQSGSFEFSNARAAMVSPLAKKLFMIDGVTGEAQLPPAGACVGHLMYQLHAL
jgi:hypothetical protein